MEFLSIYVVPSLEIVMEPEFDCVTYGAYPYINKQTVCDCETQESDTTATLEIE